MVFVKGNAKKMCATRRQTKLNQLVETGLKAGNTLGQEVKISEIIGETPGEKKTRLDLKEQTEHK